MITKARTDTLFIKSRNDSVRNNSGEFNRRTKRRGKYCEILKKTTELFLDKYMLTEITEMSTCQ
jgi:hypothetical protein